MLNKLQQIFSRSRDKLAPPGATLNEPSSNAGRAENEYLLLTCRTSDPGADLPGFAEAYHCTRCRDFFGLEWHPRSSPFVDQCELVTDIPSHLKPTDSETPGVFCPRCKSDYRIYGPILRADVPIDCAENVQVYEALDYPFPSDMPSHPKGTVLIQSLTVEKIVMLVTGEFPQEMDVPNFAYSMLHEAVLARHDGEFRASEIGGTRLHVLRTSAIVDETAWLIPFLKKHVYKQEDWHTQLFLTYGIMEFDAPLQQGLFCVILA